jgi:hypothetical protein
VDVLAEKDGKIYARATLDKHNVVCPFQDTAFACLIWDHDGRSSDAVRSAAAKSLLEAGCRYAVCAGINSEAWHDTVDAEGVMAQLHGGGDARKPTLVMTTWHDGEQPDDVAHFFVLNTDFDEVDFTRYLVLHVGIGPERERVDAAVRKFALARSAE